MSRGAGFQEEKYEALYVDLRWTKEQLTKLLDTRISKLVRQQYTTTPVCHSDVLPKMINKVPAIDYLLRRTLMRPRDVIMFFNACIKQAEGNPQITPNMIKEAEGEYSRHRLRSLADEWYADYPYLMIILDLLKGRSAHFRVESLTDDECVELAIRLMDREIVDEDVSYAVKEIERNTANTDALRRSIAALLYRVGVVGLKLEKFESVVWSSSGRRSISISEISPGTKMSIHPCFWRSLGVNPDSDIENYEGYWPSEQIVAEF